MNKRIKFLDEVIAQLGLENIDTIHGRAEDFAKPDKLREKYDVCVSRAVANLATLSEFCLPFVKVGGCFVSYKSEKISDEAMDLTGEAFLRYIYDEVTYQIAKKAAALIIADIEACGTVSR